MFEPLVSIIVPVYNVEHFISRGIESLVNQDYSNVEIIIVDDGTPDNSGKIADEWASKDKRIIVEHQMNSGVSVARNTGLTLANGQYVMFMDGDDWVESNYVSSFLSVIDSCGLSTAFNVNIINADKKKKNASKQPISAEKAIEGVYANQIDVAVWNKIYSRQVIEEHGLRFNPKLWYGEGMLFNIEYLQYVDIICLADFPVYHQTYNPESAMRKFNLESNRCGIESLEIQKEKWIKHTVNIEKQWKYHKYRFNQSILNGIIRSGLENEYPTELKNCISSIRRDILIPLTTESNIKSLLMWLCYYIAPVAMAKRAARKHQNRIIKSEPDNVLGE